MPYQAEQAKATISGFSQPQTSAVASQSIAAVTDDDEDDEEEEEPEEPEETNAQKMDVDEHESEDGGDLRKGDENMDEGEKHNEEAQTQTGTWSLLADHVASVDMNICHQVPHKKAPKVRSHQQSMSGIC